MPGLQELFATIYRQGQEGQIPQILADLQARERVGAPVDPYNAGGIGNLPLFGQEPVLTPEQQIIRALTEHRKRPETFEVGGSIWNPF